MGISLMPNTGTPEVLMSSGSQIPPASSATASKPQSPSTLPPLVKSTMGILPVVKSAAAAPPAPNPVSNFLNSFAPSVAKAAGMAPAPAPTPSSTASVTNNKLPGNVANPVPGATTPVSGGPAIPPPPPPATPGADANAANGGQYTPGSVAVGSTVLPNADPRLTGTQGAVDTASQSLANVDRTKLAQQMFDTFSQSTNPAYQASIRDATRAAAGAGRIGSGQLRTSYGDLANQRNQQLQTAQQSFMQDALEGSIGDQFNKVNALSGLEGQQYGEGTDTNNQLRTERGYQTDLEQQAINNALAQWKQQQADQAQTFNQGATTYALGTSGNPAGTLAGLSQAGLDPNYISVLAQSLASKPNTAGTTTPTGTIVNNPTNVG